MSEDTTLHGFTSGLVAGAETAEPAPAGIIDKVKSFFSPQEEKIQKQRQALHIQQEELDRKLGEAEAAREKYRTMAVSRDRLAERLRIADEQFARAKEQRDQLPYLLAAGWGTSPEALPFGPTYSHLLALDAAIAAFPEARKLIADELARAEKEMRDFEREQARL